MAALSPNFTYEELTVTNNAGLQEQNRTAAWPLMDKLRLICTILLEPIRVIAGPLEVHSGFRCPALNGVTAGSAKTSQHMLAEGVDFSRVGPDTVETINALFDQCRKLFKEKGIEFGQLIREEARRDYGKAFWIHASLGRPYRNPDRCGEVMTMKDGKYVLIERIRRPA